MIKTIVGVSILTGMIIWDTHAQVLGDPSSEISLITQSLQSPISISQTFSSESGFNIYGHKLDSGYEFNATSTVNGEIHDFSFFTGTIPSPGTQMSTFTITRAGAGNNNSSHIVPAGLLNVTSFTVDALGNPSRALFNFQGNDLESRSFYSGQMDFTAVPEPSAVVFVTACGLGCISLAYRAFGKKRI